MGISSDVLLKMNGMGVRMTAMPASSDDAPGTPSARYI